MLLIIFSPLSYLLEATQYYASSPYLRPENFPANSTIAGLSEGLAKAHEAYNVAEYVSMSLYSHCLFHFILDRRFFLLCNQGNVMYLINDYWNTSYLKSNFHLLG